MLHNEVDQYRSGPAITDYTSPSTPLGKAGVQAGDTIVHFENVENPTWEDILNRAKLNLNQTVALSYLHDGHRVDTKVNLAFHGNPDDFSIEDALDMGLVPRMQADPLKVETPVPGGPSDRAGLKPGDEIVSVDGLQIKSTPVLLNYLADEKGKPAVLNVLRNGEHLTLTVKPELTDSGDGTKAYRLGFKPVPPPVRVEQLSFRQSLVESWRFNKKSSVLIGDVLRKMFERHISVRSLSGPIGIGQVVHEAAQAPGWLPLVGTVAQISLNLGIFNLLPFPILDGGMIFLLIVESIFRRDLPMPIKERIYQVAFVCIVLFAAMVIFNDITKLPFVAKLKS
jgi:regulator of sigma E protease